MLDHQRYLADEEGQSLQPPEDAAREFIEEHEEMIESTTMNSTSLLSGVYAAAVTPLKSDLSPDLEAVAPFLAFLASRGCHGALDLRHDW